MPSRPARTARSSSRSSKRSEAAAAPSSLTTVPADATAIAVGEIGSPHGLRGHVRLWPYQPGAPSLAPGRPVLLERDGTWLAATVTAVTRHGRGMLLALAGIADRTAAGALAHTRLLVRAQD